MEGRFAPWVVAVTCSQLQLNLHTAVQHDSDSAATCYQQQAGFSGLDGRLDSPYQPGVDTRMFTTTTELEHKDINPSIENEVEQGQRCYSPAIELATAPVRRRTTEKAIALSASFETGKQTSSLPRENSLQSSPSHSPTHSIDITLVPSATTDHARTLSPTSNAHSGPSSVPVTRAHTPSAKSAHAARGVDLKPDLELARPISSSSAAVMSCKPK